MGKKSFYWWKMRGGESSTSWFLPLARRSAQLNVRTWTHCKKEAGLHGCEGQTESADDFVAAKRHQSAEMKWIKICQRPDLYAISDANKQTGHG